LHEVVEKLPLSQVTLGTDGEKPELHSTLQVPPLWTLMPVHVMVPLLIVGAAAVAHTLAAVLRTNKETKQSQAANQMYFDVCPALITLHAMRSNN
jgi:hypothetical protein